MDKKKDLRVQKTHTAIRNAFKEMICEMDANKITVMELSDRAKIHRQTFYLHYPSLEALYDEILQEILGKFAAAGATMEPPFDLAEFHRRFFLQCSRLEKHEERLICNPTYSEYCSKLFADGVVRSQSRYNAYDQWPEEIQEMIRRFLIVNLLEFYRQWVASGKKMSVDELTIITSKLMFNGLSCFIDPIPNPAGER